MKYKIKYLVDDRNTYFLKCINIDNYKLNEDYEIEIEIELNQTMVLCLYFDRYYKVMWRGKKYFGLSEDDYKWHMDNNQIANEYNYQINIDNTKSIKDLIISEIIE